MTNTTTPLEPPLAIGATEAARLLSCSKGHIHNLIAVGELPTVPHMGGRRLVPRLAIDAFVAEALLAAPVDLEPVAVALEERARLLLDLARRIRAIAPDGGADDG